MVHKHRVTYSESSRVSESITPSQLTVTNLFAVSTGQMGQDLLAFQPVPQRVLVVLWKGRFENPSWSPPMEQLKGGVTC